jgi:hypothetical protein
VRTVTEKENEEMPIRLVHIPQMERPQVRATQVDAEVHLNLKPVEVTFKEPPKVTINLNDKVPPLKK